MDSEPRRPIGPNPTACAGCLALLLLLLAAYAFVQSSASRYSTQVARPKVRPAPASSSGLPLRHRPQGRTYWLYSVGPDFKNDGSIGLA